MSVRTFRYALLTAAWLAAPCVAAADEPAVPAGNDPGGPAIAVVGPGVDYTLAEIAARMARDGEGEIVGWDFTDDDRRPFEEAASGRGTALARVILADAPASRIAVLRTKPKDLMSWGQAALYATKAPTRVVAVFLQGGGFEEWEPFRRAANHFRSHLFIVPAGDAAINLDEGGGFAAAFGNENVLTVAAADGSGRLIENANFGAKSIDVAVPAQGIEIAGPDGTSVRVSGSDVAAARVAALAARLVAAEPTLAGSMLKTKILSLATLAPGNGPPRTRSGWIADPRQSFDSE